MIKVPDDVLRDATKTIQLKARIKAVLESEIGDYHESARLCYVLLEIGVEGFRKAGVAPWLLGVVVDAIANGANMEKALEALMLLDDRTGAAPHAPGATDKRVHGATDKRVH